MGTTRSLCVVRTTHKFKSLGFVCSPSFFSLPTTYRLSRRRGLLVVYSATSHLIFFCATWTARKKFGISSNLILRLEIQACKRGSQIILQLNGWPGVNVRERYSISMVPSFKFFPLNGQMWFNGQITSWNIYLNWKRFWHVAFSNSLIIHKECN